LANGKRRGGVSLETSYLPPSPSLHNLYRATLHYLLLPFHERHSPGRRRGVKRALQPLRSTPLTAGHSVALWYRHGVYRTTRRNAARQQTLCGQNRAGIAAYYEDAMTQNSVAWLLAAYYRLARSVLRVYRACSLRGVCMLTTLAFLRIALRRRIFSRLPLSRLSYSYKLHRSTLGYCAHPHGGKDDSGARNHGQRATAA